MFPVLGILAFDYPIKKRKDFVKIFDSILCMLLIRAC